MSLKDELLNSNKLSTAFRAAVARLDADTDPDAPIFRALIKLDSKEPLSVPGANIRQGAGDIFVASDITLNGLKALVDNKRVTSIDNGQRLRPE